ncbi:MAG TPA: citrate synthase [Nitrospirae bacterium]|nr:citrate synthase 2 [bacterium BMS3Abin08]HDO36578.1 citrate synthase [Nitrospirota bacterium]HDY70371.1 citrate synthase [Nitrospirota bacterium]
MNGLIEKIAHLEEKHDRLAPELVKSRNIKLGLRNSDGTGVVVGITSKGQVKGFERDKWGKNHPVPGKLFYCGYDVETIVRNIEKEKIFGFEEVIYLLLTGELPRKADLDSFSAALAERRGLPQLAKKIIRYNSENDDQMGALHIAVASLHKFDTNPRSTNIRDVTRQCIDLIAKAPTIIAYNYCVLRGDDVFPNFVEPDPNLSTAQNFLYMLNGKVPDDFVAHLFDQAMVLHAEHGGGNNSTFTVRTVSSSLTDTYMAICAGIASLSGHLHGGANEAVMRMMEDIKRNVRDWRDDQEIYAYLEMILDKKAGDGSGKIYGIGHAVYTISDPREKILKEKARSFAEMKGRLDEFELYNKVSELAVKLVRRKKGKRACPNVDFYSGFVYDMMGIPGELYTPIFAMSRVAGWSAHRIEEIIQGKLIRPAYISSLKETRDYIPLSQR